MLSLPPNSLLGDLQVRHAAGIGLVVLAVVVLFIKMRRRAIFSAKYRFPNPVPGRPIVGNTLLMLKKDAFLEMEKLARQYGEMFTLRIGGNHWVFLNSNRTVNDLLERRASIYSSRISMPMAQDIATGGKILLLMPYGDLWRRERKIMHQILNNTQSRMFEPYQDMESKAMLMEYVNHPEDWWKANSSYAASIIMGVTLGRRATPDDETVKAALGVVEEIVQFFTPGRAVVDVLPFLAKIPYLKSLQPWRWYGDDLYQRTTEIFRKEVNAVRQRMKEGKQKTCFLSEFIDEKHDKDFTEEELLHIVGALLLAGTDTTSSTLNQVAAAATLWPDWVERTRKQLDEVCGPNAERLPKMSDMPHLPLIKATAKECLRWKSSLTELGVPHALTKDDEYEGYRLPAGTVVVYNFWAISNSDSEYPNPQRFLPERFLNDDLDNPTKGHLGFGRGRRVCVGYNVGIANVHIAIARLLYCMDFAPVLGSPIDDSNNIRFEPHRASFATKITPRSEAHRQLILRECQDSAW